MHHICTLSTDWLMFAQCWHMSAQYTCIDVLCNASNYSSYQTMQSWTKLFQDVSRYSVLQFWTLSLITSCILDLASRRWQSRSWLAEWWCSPIQTFESFGLYLWHLQICDSENYGESAWAPHCLMYSSASSFFSKTLPKLAQRSKLECQCGLMMTI